MQDIYNFGPADILLYRNSRLISPNLHRISLIVLLHCQLCYEYQLRYNNRYYNTVNGRSGADSREVIQMERVAFEQFIDLFAEMIEKYGDDVLKEAENDIYEKDTA